MMMKSLRVQEHYFLIQTRFIRGMLFNVAFNLERDERLHVVLGTLTNNDISYLI